MRKKPSGLSTSYAARIRKLLALSLVLLSCVGGAATASPNTSDKGMPVMNNTGKEHSSPHDTTRVSLQNVTMVATNSVGSMTDFEFNGSGGRSIKFGRRGMAARFTGSAEAQQPAEQRYVLPAQAGGDELVRIRLFISGF